MQASCVGPRVNRMLLAFPGALWFPPAQPHTARMNTRRAHSLVLLCLVLMGIQSQVQARTVYRCLRDGTPSLATAPEPGSRCVAVEVDDNSAKLPNLWGSIGLHKGTLYQRQQDGKTVYSTRDLPGSVKVLGFTVHTPVNAQAHAGLGSMGPPRLDAFAAQFSASAKATGVDDALLRAIAHVESGFDRQAQSPKGAQGVMQLMPTTAARYGVTDAFASDQSIRAGARHVNDLMTLYKNDLTLVAAAYNAGVGTVARYGGVPPYAETEAYVAKVLALHARYNQAMQAAKASATGRTAVGKKASPKNKSK